jgi:hypothetical protein
MLAAPPRTLLALDLVGPVEAEPAQLAGPLRSGVTGAKQTTDKGTPAPAGEAGTAVDQRCITRQMVWPLTLGEASTS